MSYVARIWKSSETPAVSVTTLLITMCTLPHKPPRTETNYNANQFQTVPCCTDEILLRYTHCLRGREVAEVTRRYKYIFSQNFAVDHRTDGQRRHFGFGISFLTPIIYYA
jgi:hypothetical protein